MSGYFIGIDGGGTTTVARAADTEGREIFCAQGGAINPNGGNEDAVRESLWEILRTVIRQAGPISACGGICIGAAGISNPSAHRLLSRSVAESGYRGKLYITGDYRTALFGALRQPQGAIVIAGTGSVCYGVKSGVERRVGGLGHLIDDEGSGYAIGADILKAVCRWLDGRNSPTLLTDLLAEKHGLCSLEEIIGFLYAPLTTKRDVAGIAPLLDIACEKQDEAAMGIAVAAAQGLARLVFALDSQMSLKDLELGLCGSILVKCRYVRQPFTEMLAAGLPNPPAWVLPRGDAAAGALLVLRESSFARGLVPVVL